jgi:hypothetical protein
MNLPIFGQTPGSFSGYPTFEAPANYEDDAPQPAPRAKRASGAAFGYGKAVCVRLCDGSFFPTTSVSGGEAACAAQCPDAPTALYTMPTDRIEDAVSSTGQPYSKLPVASRFETSFDGGTCTCHRDNAASARIKELLSDPTLRKGDIVMTADGFRVFEGSGYGAASQADFVTLSRAGNVSKAQRAELAAMEKSSSGSPALAAPAVVVARPKGNVTVDDGDPAPAR